MFTLSNTLAKYNLKVRKNVRKCMSKIEKKLAIGDFSVGTKETTIQGMQSNNCENWNF